MGDTIVMSLAAADTPRPEAAERLGQLFDTHYSRLYSLARRLTKSPDAARDAIQDTFLRAARSPHSSPWGMPHEEAWLVRVLINICKDEWRKQADLTEGRLDAGVAVVRLHRRTHDRSRDDGRKAARRGFEPL